MKSRLRIEIDWAEAPDDDEAIGPEVPTWALLSLRTDDFVLTRNGPLTPSPRPDAIRDHVEGPLSGLAEWVVDHLGPALWERLPVGRLDPESGAPRIPGEADAVTDWEAWPAEREALSSWYGRHTLGAATTQLALPSLVLAPEPETVCLAGQPLPEKLRPTVRFRLPPDGMLTWHDRDELRDEMRSFVRQVIDRARLSDPDSAAWAEWLEKRLETSIDRERDERRRKQWLFGSDVANRLALLSGENATHVLLIEQLLGDLEPGLPAATVDTLLELTRASGGEAKADQRKTLGQAAKAVSGRPYEQGYALAREVRRVLHLGTQPIDRVDIEVVQALGIEDRQTQANGLYNVAAFVDGGRPTLVVDSSRRSVAARRQALCVGVGRVLFDLSRGPTGGAADSAFARTQATQRSRAFAAELLAPLEIVKEYANEPEALAEEYGISRGAARWRIENLERRRG